jgi:hypothetical protein
MISGDYMSGGGGEPIRLGPFVGGINILSDTTALQDTELVDASNVELDLDGSYIARPPFYDLAAPSSGGRIKLLGFYIDGTVLRLIGLNSTGLWYYTSGSWTFIAGTGGITSTAMVQYDDKAWIVATAASTNPGGYISGTTFTAVAAIPRGGSAVIHKERMYIVPGPSVTGSNSTLLKFSDPADPATWPGSNSIFINKGDGQKLIDIIVYNDNLLLFKEDSTYVLAFDVSPSESITRKINPSIGVSNKDCVVAYENQLYVLHENNVYEVVNYDFAKINSKVPLKYDSTAPSGGWSDPFFLTLLGDRLIVKYYANFYVFGLKTKVWTRWDTWTVENRYVGPAVAVPIKDEANAIPTYYMSSSASTVNEFYGFRDTIDSQNAEEIEIILKTKDYDFGVPHRYKRLFFWGVDVSTVREIIGIVQPIIVNFSVTWGQLSAYTWGQISGNTWGQPLNLPVVIETSREAGSARRKFAKFKKSLRFRQANFEVRLTYNGTTTTGPLRIFTITCLIATKEHSSKALT